MRTKIQFPSLPALLLALCALLAFALPAVADNFNATNVIPANTTTTSYPTNSTGTNGIGALTGGAISIANQEWAGFTFTGSAYYNSNTCITVNLIRSTASGPPQMTLGTNNQWYASDWETTNNIPLIIPITGTNITTWSTNLDRALIGWANWIGIYSIGNTNTGTAITNMVFTLNKKIIPIRYP